MTGKDYYQILGLTSSASDEDIKKAYRRLALECHPDHHPADADLEERFKRVTEAYSILGDAEKRRSYDLRSRRSRSDREGFDQSPEDMFLQFVESEGFDIRKASCMSGIRGCRRKNSAMTYDMAHEVSITPTQAALGIRTKITVPTGQGQRTYTFRLPPGVESGSQFKLVLDRAQGISVLVRVKIVKPNGELSPETNFDKAGGDDN